MQYPGNVVDRFEKSPWTDEFGEPQMAANEEIIEEILTCSSSANEEEIVHIIQSNEGQDAAQETGLTEEEGESQEHKELVFWVPALLMVGREQQRITVTQDELKRRVAPPECLSQTMLLSLLRLSKEKGRELKETLAKNGIKKLTSKSAVISCFTKLTEMEAAQLAEDYFYLASKHLRLREINREILRSREGWENFEIQANQTKELLQDILREIESRDTNLSLITHGFSPLIIRAVIDILVEIITFHEA
ncbi:transcription factor AP-2-delta-like isoform X1 [Penaeus chinensis]|uniref:transcription factor AP-2-delta-like isoform X1 n=1 Tax=Penaeus chinensis TaxID=139456 RepID=UPI001FB7CD73|nr:transcription factor AP-2-delta-like isoform X1 [Penaeus chinensis]